MSAEFDYYITLVDENGYEAELLLLDEFSLKGNDYAVFMPEGEDEQEVVILQVVEDGEYEEYLSVNDEELLAEVFREFKSSNSDCFIFADEDDDY